MEPGSTERCELERKFLLTKLPDLSGYPNKHVVTQAQGYLIAGDGELRLRVEEDENKIIKFYLTAKTDGHLERQQWENEIPEWVFDQFWTEVKGKFVEKERTIIPGNDLTFEIDRYFRPSGLIIFEIEFVDLNASECFVLPKWVGEAVEVTNNPHYKAKNLAYLNAQGI